MTGSDARHSQAACKSRLRSITHCWTVREDWHSLWLTRPVCVTQCRPHFCLRVGSPLFSSRHSCGLLSLLSVAGRPRARLRRGVQRLLAVLLHDRQAGEDEAVDSKAGRTDGRRDGEVDRCRQRCLSGLLGWHVACQLHGPCVLSRHLQTSGRASTRRC